MQYRYWFAIIACLALLQNAVVAEMAMTTVIRVDRNVAEMGVVLGAGRTDGLEVGAEVTLLRQGEPIVHPLTDEVLGVPQEPVGLAQVVEVQERQAQAVLLRQYSMPQVEDMAEYEKVVAMPVRLEREPDAEIVQRMKDLERNVSQYRKSNKAIKGYPVFAQQVWEELTSIKSYLVALDERLIVLEERQNEDHVRLSSVMSGEYQQDMKEFTIRYAPDTKVKLKVAGKTPLIDVERDSLEVDLAEDQLAAMKKLKEEVEEEEASWWDKIMAELAADEEEEEEVDLEAEGGEEEMGFEEEEGGQEKMAGEGEEGGAWYSSRWAMGGVVLLFAMTAMFVFYNKLFRRSDDLLDDDDDDDFEEFDEEEYEEE